MKEIEQILEKSLEKSLIYPKTRVAKRRRLVGLDFKKFNKVLP